MDNIKDKLKAIEEHKESLKEEARKRAEAIEHERERLVLELSNLAPRIKDLLIIGRALVDAGIPLGKKTPFPDDSNELVSNCWSHRVGYVVDYGCKFGIGMLGGGACGKHFAVDENGKTTSLGGSLDGWFISEKDYDFILKARAFIYGFDEFDKKVSEFVNNLGK